MHGHSLSGVLNPSNGGQERKIGMLCLHGDESTGESARRAPRTLRHVRQRHTHHRQTAGKRLSSLQNVFFFSKENNHDNPS